MKNLLIPLLFVLGVAVAQSATAPYGAAGRPNVIIVLTDDQGFGDLGLHGNVHLRTPATDRFAREGVQFSRFYTSPVCAPTRAALMTGRYYYRTGVIHTSRGGAKMHGDEVTVAELLRSAGYRTGIFGKWHLGDNYPMRPTDQGFEEALIHKSGGIGQGQPEELSSYFDPHLWRNNEPVWTEGYCTDVFFAAALEFIEQSGDQPFFVYLSTNAPHAPLEVSPRYSDPYRAMGLDDTTARVYGMVENIDENFGRLLAALDRLEIRSNTLVMFLSDNGPQQPRYNAGLRGRKGTAYEGGIRVPGFFQWPERLAAGGLIDRIAADIDLLPTVLDACGVQPPQSHHLDGVSLLPLLTGSVGPESWPERTLFVQSHRGLTPRLYQNFAAMTQRFKLLGYPGTFGRESLDTSSSPPLLELYDLDADRGEERDLAAQHPQIVDRLRGAYEAWFADVRAARNFAPGVIHIGSDKENPMQLARYQDGEHHDNVHIGWPVKIVQSAAYAITFFRGAYSGAGSLAVEWNSRIARHSLSSGEDSATFNLTAGEGLLDIWLEDAEGTRVRYSGNNPDGDVLLRRL